jgi:nucleoside-diphosphate-sugar epimerase
MTEVAVTGAHGFLGRHLVRRAEARGGRTRSIARESKEGALAMKDVLATPSLLDGVDVLVHSAAIRHRHGSAAADYRASNIDLVDALMRAAAGRVSRFVFVSSVGVYGFPTDLPVSERTPFRPRTLYSQTKIEAEKLARKRSRELGLPLTIVRPCIFYGPGDKNGMLDKLAQMIAARRYVLVGRGDNTLHHAYVEDVAEATLLLGSRDDTAGEDFIVAGPETTTLRDLSFLVARSLGRTVPRLRVPLPFARSVATLVDVAAHRGLYFDRHEPPINHEKLDVMTVPIAFDIAKLRAAGFDPPTSYAQGIPMTLGGAA